MTLDDDSILSAYLDGELGPEQQQAVESAVVADPRLAEDLRDLALLRDLLAGLPRRAPADMTARVMRRVRHRARFGKARRLLAWGPVGAAGVAAIAAGVLFALGLSWLLHQDGRGPAGDRSPDPLAQRQAREVARRRASEHHWPFSSQPIGRAATDPLGPGERREAQPERTASDESTPGELMHVREYLDNPQLRHIFLVTDLGDGAAEQRVADVVEQTTRFSYYKFTIAQGIVIDPRHPDQATVFALAVDPNELVSLRDRLRAALKDRVEEERAEARIVTQLADIGSVRACRPVPIPDIDIPRDDLAYAYRVGVAATADQGAEPVGAERPQATGRATKHQEYSSPRAELLAREQASGKHAVAGRQRAVTDAGQHPGHPAPAREAEQPLVVLVWVSRPRPG